MSFPLQDTEGDQAAGNMMQLRPFRARLTATQAKLIVVDAEDFFNLCPDAREPTHLSSRQGEAMGRLVLGVKLNKQGKTATATEL